MTSRQIGWSQESNLLYEIGKQLDILAKVLANSGKGSLEAYPDLASFPPVGVSGVIYLAEDTGYIYYWDGASYVQFGGGSYVPTSRQLTINGVTFDLSADRTWTISTGDDITVVANYSALPAPNTVTGQFYWCSNPQGTAWLPGSVGGTYYNSGLYYSNGTTWEFLNVPYQATQSEVNAGIITDKFVTPNTLFNSSQWATKQGTLSLTTTGTSGAATLVGNTLNIPQYSGGGGGMAIGGSITSATAGSVLFTGTSGVLAQDNSNLFWDNTNKRLGIGTATPSYPFHIKTSSRFGFTYECTDDTANQHYIFLYRNSATPANNDGIGTILFEANNSSLVRSTYAYFGGRIISTIAGSHSGEIYFTTTAAGTETDKLVIKPTGNVLIQNGGTFTDSGERLQVTGSIKSTSSITSSVSGSTVSFIAYNPAASFPRANFEIGNSASDTNIGLQIAASSSSSTLQKQAFIIVSTNKDALNASSYQLNFGVSTTIAEIITTNRSGSIGAGAGVPIAFSPSGVEAMRLTATSGNLLIGTNTDVSSSILTLSSTTKGFLPPKMTTTQKNAIASPVAGLVVFDTTLNKLCVYTTAWETITSI